MINFMISRKLVAITGGLLFISSFALAEDIYVAQNATGNSNGTDCSNARVYTWFNTFGNWGTGSGKISPGDTVHLCGTLTGTTGVSILTFQGGGSPGNPITVKWEEGAKLTSPACGNNHSACIEVGYSYVVLDGNGTNPSIELTDNGSAPAYSNQRSPHAIYAPRATGSTFKNLAIKNVYVRTSKTDTAGDGAAIYLNGSNVLVDGLTCDHSYSCVNFPYQDGDTNIEVKNSTFDHFNWGVMIGNNNTSAVSDIRIHDNHLKSMDNWDEPATNIYHHDGIFIFNNNPGGAITNVQIYNNLADGNMGAFSTAWVYMNTAISGAYIYNNILTRADSVSGGYMIFVGYAGDKNYNIYNNYLGCNGIGGGVRIRDAINVTLKNNLINGCPIELMASGTVTGVAIDYNIYQYSGTERFYFLDVGSTWDVYRARNATLDVNSKAQSDVGVSNDGKLQSGSPAIGAGTNLTYLGITALNYDKAGQPRPVVGPWSVGAYTLPPNPLAPPTGLSATPR